MSPLPKATASNKQISMGNVFAKCYKNCVEIPDLWPKNLIQGGSLRFGRHRAHDLLLEVAPANQSKKGPKRKFTNFTFFCVSSGLFLGENKHNSHRILFRSESSCTDLLFVWFARATPDIFVGVSETGSARV